ncbi:hypothetical protein CY35_17G086400 [Sphagnum magellanicum]|nr:hypothetical protein CY35_17G086400 [Sphagnum magellanicum]
MATAQRGAEVLSVFRTLLRTRRKCFEGDMQMLVAVAAQIRAEFEEHKSVTDEAQLEQLLGKAREAVDFMQFNIVQAKLNERGNYEVKLEPEHAGASLEEPIPDKAPMSS